MVDHSVHGSIGIGHQLVAVQRPRKDATSTTSNNPNPGKRPWLHHIPPGLVQLEALSSSGLFIGNKQIEGPWFAGPTSWRSVQVTIGLVLECLPSDAGKANG